MPCKICGHILIDYNDKITCPKCTNLKILDSLTASIISCRRKNIFRKLWKNDLTKIEQNSLLLHIFRHREFTARDFWKKMGLMDIDTLFSDTLFLKRVMQDGNPNGTLFIDSVEKAEPIIKLFNETKQVETDFVLINSCYALMLYEKDFDLNSLNDEVALANFRIVQTEEYLKLKKSYENYSLYTKEDAEKKFKEYADEYDKIKQTKVIPKFHTREQFIQKNYVLISNLYMILLRNAIYSEAFEMRNLSELSSDPSTIMRFFNNFPYLDGALTEDDTEPFLNRCRNFFKRSMPVIRRTIIFEPENQDVFPIVLRSVWKRDSVFLSQAFMAIMFILLHAIITKDLFDDETSQRGKIFEGKVKEKFEDLGYCFLPNIKDDKKNPTLEIDGIAVKSNYCFVIEDKNRRLPPEVESTEAKKTMIDDLKGIIDGYKRTIKNSQRVTKSIKSLPEKIDFVKNNLKDIGIVSVSKEKVFGLVVTHDFPLLPIYKGINFLWLSDVSEEKLVEIISI